MLVSVLNEKESSIVLGNNQPYILDNKGYRWVTLPRQSGSKSYCQQGRFNGKHLRK